MVKLGKSDPYIHKAYLDTIGDQREYESIGFYGFSKNTPFTDSFISNDKNFYDLSLENWNINNHPYEDSKKFDLIVCTRCAYFSKNPEKMIDNFYDLLKDDGKILIDWGLGDHWRYEKYKIGWVKDGEHESFYDEENYLWSCLWDDMLIQHPHFRKFEKGVTKLGYPDARASIYDEVPSILSLAFVHNLFDNIKINMVSLWEESPQLYIILFGSKR